MLQFNKVVPGTLTRSRTAFALIAATLLVGGTVSEASAKSRHHRHHQRYLRRPRHRCQHHHKPSVQSIQLRTPLSLS